jgi:hypothetical protein
MIDTKAEIFVRSIEAYVEVERMI